MRDQGPENPYTPRWLRYEPSMRGERDRDFQIHWMDWMIGFSLVVLVVVVCVGVWAIYKMVMIDAV